MKISQNMSTYSNHEFFSIKNYKNCDQYLKKLSKKTFKFVRSPKGGNNFRPPLQLIARDSNCLSSLLWFYIDRYVRK